MGSDQNNFGGDEMETLLRVLRESNMARVTPREIEREYGSVWSHSASLRMVHAGTPSLSMVESLEGGKALFRQDN